MPVRIDKQRIGHALRVRVVRAEHDVVGADGPAQPDRVVLVERVHEDVPLNTATGSSSNRWG
jgi:hypothetical protein